MRIALATCLKLPKPDPDRKPLIDAILAQGAEAEWLAWDDPKADFSRFDLCVLRSTWNYIHVLPLFLEWIERTSQLCRVMNPPDVLRWNSDKSYLGELAQEGVPVIPTIPVPKGSSPSLDRLLGGRSWSRIVIKPRFGAGSFATRRFQEPCGAEARDFLERSSAERDMMIQPYLPSVEGPGEKALVWIAGELTHAIRKAPRFGTDDEKTSEALRIAPDEREFAERILRPWAGRLLYGRVDVARDEDGKLLLMELELLEPSLFLIEEPRALDRLARACVGNA